MPPTKQQIDEGISERVAKCEQRLNFFIGAVTVLRDEVREIFRDLEIPKTKRKRPAKARSSASKKGGRKIA